MGEGIVQTQTPDLAVDEQDPPSRKQQKELRRLKILEEAGRLFRERGFHAVGVDDIGEAAGITGPGVYRHFDSKNDILVALIERITEDFWRVMDIEPDGDVWELLQDVLHSYVEIIWKQRHLAVLWVREQPNLDPKLTRNLHMRERRFVDYLTHLLIHIRPELPDAHARVAVHGALGLALNAISLFHSGLDPEQLVALVERMALASLLSWPALSEDSAQAIAPRAHS